VTRFSRLRSPSIDLSSPGAARRYPGGGHGEVRSSLRSFPVPFSCLPEVLVEDARVCIRHTHSSPDGVNVYSLFYVRLTGCDDLKAALARLEELRQVFRRHAPALGLAPLDPPEGQRGSYPMGEWASFLYLLQHAGHGTVEIGPRFTAGL